MGKKVGTIDWSEDSTDEQRVDVKDALYDSNFRVEDDGEIIDTYAEEGGEYSNSMTNLFGSIGASIRSFREGMKPPDKQDN